MSDPRSFPLFFLYSPEDMFIDFGDRARMRGEIERQREGEGEGE